MGILLDPTEEYAARKDKLSPERRESLEYEEHEIAGDPDQYFRLELDGVRYHRFDFGFIAYRRTGRNNGQLIRFAFLDDPEP